MILVGNPRGGGRDLAQHLMKTDNERVEVAQLRGFIADDLDGAFRETYAVSRGTRCQQYLFSLSLNPPKDARVYNEAFFRAADQAEAKLGLSGQPRALVFHEKRGDDGQVRRHAHAVWSRINVEDMKAIPLPHSKRKLQDVARELYLEHGWTMPRGLAVSGERDPRNFTLEQWQQAKRAGVDVREVKTAFQDAWAISDTQAAFAHALKERGYWLARGDKRGHVAIDHRGEIYAVSKWADVRTKAVRERLGEPDNLPSVSETKIEIARAMQTKMQDFQREVAEREEREKAEAAKARETLKVRQHAERQAQYEASRLRAQADTHERKSRLRTGLAGLWDRLRGERKRTLERNALEAESAQRRDKEARERLTETQMSQRRDVVMEQARKREETKTTTRELTEDARMFRQMEADAGPDRHARLEAFKERRRTEDRPRRRSRSRDGPSFER